MAIFMFPHNNFNFLHDYSDLECILTFCDNATEEPNTNGANYNFTWDGNRIPIDTFVSYPCQDDMAIENATIWKNLSSTESLVYCDPSDGLMKVNAGFPQEMYVHMFKLYDI